MTVGSTHAMEATGGPDEDHQQMVDMMERVSLCLPDYDTGIVLHRGDPGFQPEARRHFSTAENDAGERLFALKERLRDASTADFWRGLMEGMTAIMDAQYGFVSKRMLVDRPNAAVEMPPIGEPGSCLMAEAFYYNDGHGQSDFFRHWSYAAYGAPCGHMKHDKVLLIPERLNDFIPNNPNAFPFPVEAYLAVPLSAEGKCFAHVGVMWSPEAAARRRLSWGYLELLMHALEDLILQRLLTGQTFGPSHPVVETAERRRKVIPHEAIMASQSLKPYARSLSHELRTPMQGIVGMLDIMHANVQESAEISTSPPLRKIFASLRESIEVLQDSSKRAVEAADNVVQAYDLNMEVPGTPDLDLELDHAAAAVPRGRAERASSEENGVRDQASPKRRRRSRSMGGEDARPSIKRRAVEATDEAVVGMHLVAPVDSEASRGLRSRSPPPSRDLPTNLLLQPSTPGTWPGMAIDRPTTPGLRPTRLRHLLPVMVQDCLQNGGRPESVTVVSTPLGEDMEARCRTAQGEIRVKMVRWTVDPEVPSTIPVDERDFVKLVSCVLLNAIKFTEEGMITVTAQRSQNRRYVVIRVEDTGPGIPSTFQPELFKAFSREDDSLTRRKDGLGLGLLVAKGIARKIGGDVLCVRSDTTGPRHGSEFEIRMPLGGFKDVGGSIPGSPLARTPTPTPPPPPLLPSIERHRPARSERRSPRAAARTAKGNQDSHSSPSVDADQARLEDEHDQQQPRRSPLLMHEAVTDATDPRSLSNTTLSAPSPSHDRPNSSFDRTLATKHPLTFLVVEDNHINRKLLVNMLGKLGYRNVYEAYDGADAVRQMTLDLVPPVDVILMDLWMPCMDGFEATTRILSMPRFSQSSLSSSLSSSGLPADDDDDDGDDDGDGDDDDETNETKNKDDDKASTRKHTRRKKRRRRKRRSRKKDGITILAVTADATDEASSRAMQVGMKGLMTKPYKLIDLERTILEFCVGLNFEEDDHDEDEGEEEDGDGKEDGKGIRDLHSEMFVG